MIDMVTDIDRSPQHALSALAPSLATQIGGYLLLALLLFLIFWVLGERRFAARRVQKIKRFGPKQLWHELRYTMATFLVSSVSVGAVLLLHQMGHTKLVDSPASLSLGPLAKNLMWLLGLTLCNDAWFYVWHRLLHTPTLFRIVHAVHHKSVDVNPFSSYSFHPLESFVLGAWIVPAALLLPIPMPVLGAAQVIGLFNNVYSHLGYELLPAWWIQTPMGRWLAGSTFHSMHHVKLSGNYGLFFRFWDKLLGTEVPGYEAAFVDRTLPRKRNE